MKSHISKILVALFLLVGLKATAGVENATTLCVLNNSGEIISFQLADNPKLTIKGNYVIVQASNTKLFKFKDLYKAYFESDDPSAVNDAKAEGGAINTQADNINFRNFAPSSPVLVYTTSGTLMKRASTDAQGTLSLSIEDLPAGVYVIKAGKTSFKVTKK